jgi:integrase/recombinase XerD
MVSAVSAKARQLLKLYAQDARVRLSERTSPAYVAYVQAFADWLSKRGVDLAQARAADVLAYQSHLYAVRKRDGRPYTIGTQINRLAAVQSLYRFLYKRGYVLHDPAASLEMPRREKRLPRVIMTQAEARRIIETPERKTPQGLRDRAILETLYATGVRVSELGRLVVDDVDTEERILRVVLGKGRKYRNVPLTRPAAEAIEHYLVRGRPRLLGRVRTGHLFLGKQGVPLNRRALNVIVRARAAEAKVKKHVTCHTFRHTVATHLLRRRADIRHIQALLGHASLSATERYTRVEVSDLKRVIERAHPRGK